ncbi:MAG: DUF1735 domain-containing protein [Paludibacter sp.]|nr:DUF1735 domain-containing protein [Paludibacter sp.]
MKRNKYGLIMLAFIALTAGFSSCLNDEMIENQEYGLINLNANKIIEIPDGTINLTEKNEGLKTIELSSVRLAAEYAAEEDIVVSLSIDKSAEILGNVSLLSPANIQIPASVTILKGERVSEPIVISLNTDALTADPSYIAISISSTDKSGYLISGNLGHLTLGVKGPHKWEGRYILTGTMVDSNSPTLSHVTSFWAIDTEENPNGDPYTVQIRSKNGSTLMFYDEIVGEGFFGNGFYYPINVGGDYSVYGSFTPEFVFDAVGNITAVVNHSGQPAANSRSAEIDPSGINKYDEATKSFSVSYWMNQPTVIAGHRCHMVETYTFLEKLD